MTHRRFSQTARGKRLYRDRENGMIMGVCAGVADFFDWNVTVVRVLAALLLIFHVIPTLIVYFALAFLLRDKPLHYRGESDETRFWRGKCRDRV